MPAAPKTIAERALNWAGFRSERQRQLDARTAERACMILARLSGDKLNTALVKTFVNAITFFPIGSVVRTSRNELGLVVQTTPGDPLHPVLVLLDEETYRPVGRADTAERDSSGGYARHISQSIPAPDELDLRLYLDSARAA
jgi:hypothetical protein